MKNSSIFLSLSILAAFSFNESRIYAEDKLVPIHLDGSDIQSSPAPVIKPTRLQSIDKTQGDSELVKGEDFRPALKQLLVLLAQSEKDINDDTVLDLKIKDERIKAIREMMKIVLSTSDSIEKNKELKEMIRISLALNICGTGEFDLGFLPFVNKMPASPGVKAGACITIAQTLLPKWPHNTTPVFGLSAIAGGQLEKKAPSGTSPFEFRTYLSLIFPNPALPGDVKYKLSDLRGVYGGVTLDVRGPTREKMILPQTFSGHLQVRLPQLDLFSVSVPLLALGGSYTDDIRPIHAQGDLYYFAPMISTDGSAQLPNFSGDKVKQALSDPDVLKIISDPKILKERLDAIERENALKKRR